MVRGRAFAAAAVVAALVSACGTPNAPGPEASSGPAEVAPVPIGDPSTESELSRGGGERPHGATADVPRLEIMAQLARRAERIANRTPLAPVPADIDRDSNRGIGYQLMLEFGFGADQWPYLDALWTRESGWNHLAENRSSGAYGIPQSLPGNKMAVVGPDWRTNPLTQIRWGLAYIAARYGSAQQAWRHSERVGWY